MILLVGHDGRSERLAAALRRKRLPFEAHGFGSYEPDSFAAAEAVIIELKWPGVDGVPACNAVRTVSDVPLIIVADRAEPELRARALTAGADDYIVEPYDEDEVVARIRAIARRHSYAAAGSAAKLHIGDIEIDLVLMQVKVAGSAIELTKKEFQLLVLIAKKAGAVCSVDTLAEQVWGRPRTEVDESLYVHLSRIRTKIGRPEIIKTVRTSGYRLVPDARP